DEAVATLVAVADGTTSLYFSTGGGVIGAGEHEAVADPSRRWLLAAQEFLPTLSPTLEPPLPEPGLTRFVAVTPGGLLDAGAPEAELGGGEPPLSPLFYAGHDVITQIRLLQGGLAPATPAQRESASSIASSWRPRSVRRYSTAGGRASTRRRR